MNNHNRKHPIEYLTVIMPIRIDSTEREDNLRTVLRLVCGYGLRTIVLEADKQPLFGTREWRNEPQIKDVEYLFIQDNLPVFHRTKYINNLLQEVESDIVAVWDTDILVPFCQILDGLRLIEQGNTIVYPYSGRYVMLPETVSRMVRQNVDFEYLKGQVFPPVFGRRFCGGVFLVHRPSYLLCGGENENFVGWGPEDAERLRRVRILGHRATWIGEGEAYHLYHPRGKNSDFQTNKDAIRMREELIKICSMDKEKLYKYIQLWKQVKKN